MAVEASAAGVATAILAFKALKFAESIEGATLAMKALNLVTSANPIGIIATVAGIAAAGLTAFAFSAGHLIRIIGLTLSHMPDTAILCSLFPHP